MRLLAPVILLALIVLFLAGLLVPQRSRRLQGWMDRRLRRGEHKGARSRGRPGDWTAKTLRFMRRSGDRTVEAGRRVRRRLSR